VSQRGEIVFDPFLGSGSTLIAAEKTGRVCRGAEIDPRYVDVILQRWIDTGGDEPRLAATGQPFGEVSAERSEHPTAEQAEPEQSAEITIIRAEDHTDAEERI